MTWMDWWAIAAIGAAVAMFYVAKRLGSTEPGPKR